MAVKAAIIRFLDVSRTSCIQTNVPEQKDASCCNQRSYFQRCLITNMSSTQGKYALADKVTAGEEFHHS